MATFEFNAQAVAHIPHGSGDAEYQIVDRDTGIVLAIIDPAMVIDEPAEFAEHVAALLRGEHERA